MTFTARRAVAADQLPEVCADLVETEHARLVVMTGTDERRTGGGYGLYYTFALAAGGLVTVEAQIDPAHPVFPSVTRTVPAAHWYEREVKDMLGVEPLGHPDPRRLVLHDDWPRGQQQAHLDFVVTDIAAAHERVLALGGTALDPVEPPKPAPERGFRVYADPAGHPFCLCRPTKDAWG